MFARAREAARKSNCVSNMKQLATGALMYVQDYDEIFPPGGIVCNTANADGTPGCIAGALMQGQTRRGYGDTWQGGGTAVLQPYIKNQGIVWCPNNQINGFGEGYLNNFQWLGALAVVGFPAQKVMFMESTSFHDGDRNNQRYCCSGASPQPFWRPPYFYNTAFIDGHVKPVRLDRGCGGNNLDPQCAGWSSCSGPGTNGNTNYVCSGTSPNVPDFP